MTVLISFFASLNSFISSFINYRIFPRISVDTACLPRSQGGLGLINPQLQQSALHLRWLRPLLDQTSAQILSSSLIVLHRLVSFLLSRSPPSPSLYPSPPQHLDHRFSLLFPCRRPTPLRYNERSWSLLFKAIDRLSKDFSNTIVSASTYLEIPLASVVIPSSSSVDLSRSLAKLPSSLAYTMDSDTDFCLRPKRPGEFSVHSNLAKRFMKLVKHNDIKLAPFFVRAFIHSHFSALGRFPFRQVADHSIIDLTPFVKTLNLCSSPDTGIRRQELSTKSYRRLCRSPPPDTPLLPLPFSPDIPVNWFDFWLLSISHSCRNIWYRFLHRKLPHKSLLNRIIPEFFPTPSCALCSQSNDTLDHFLFSCPIKLTVWQLIQQRHLPFLASSLTSFDLHLLLTTLRFPTDFPQSATNFEIKYTLYSYSQIHTIHAPNVNYPSTICIHKYE
ncbi:hypothetical protein BD408DRAFT_414951 [Parasitella parasitica]|nr:hypothetical protein BD408DRAFT_414951 [Parasitella parasitica]